MSNVSSKGTRSSATKRNNVISIRRRQEEKAKRVTLLDVMHDAVAALTKETGEAKVASVVKWIFKRYPDKWAASTIQTYFCYMCRPRAFVRTHRGHYRNTGSSSKTAVA
jgi:hypothetical protein